MKKVFLWLLIIAMIATFTLVGCQKGGEAVSEETTAAKAETTEETTATTEAEETTAGFKVGCTLMDMNNYVFVNFGNAVEERCEELGWESIIHDSKSDAAVQVAGIENMIEQECDAIIVCAQDVNSVVSVLQEARDKGIIIVDQEPEVEIKDAYNMLDAYEYGYPLGEAAGEWIAETFGKDAEVEVAILDYDVQEFCKPRTQGQIDGIMDNAPNAKVVARQTANAMDLGLNKTEAILQAHPNVKVILGINDVAALGAYQAVKAAGMDETQVFVGGCDAVDEAVALIKKGTAYKGSVWLDMYNCGLQCMDLVQEVIDNGGSPQMEPIVNVIGCTKVTVDNVDELFPDVAPAE